MLEAWEGGEGGEGAVWLERRGPYQRSSLWKLHLT